jgi:hypothetical protein
MNKILLIFTLGLLSSFIYAQSDTLIFDIGFNGGNYHGTFESVNEGNTGRLKRLNDTCFLYFTNHFNMAGTESTSRVYAKIVHSNGTVSEAVVYEGIFTLSQTINWIHNAITDIIVTGPSTFVVVKNEFNQVSNKVNIRLLFYSPAPVGSGMEPWFLPNVSINSGSGSFLIDANYDITGGIGYNTANSIDVYANVPGNGFCNVVRISVINLFTTPTWSVSNLTIDGSGEYNYLADLIRGDGVDVFVALNKYSISSSGAHLSNARVYKVQSSIANATSFPVLWNTSPQAFAGERINRIVIDANDPGKIWVIGARISELSGNIQRPMARAQRFNLDGTNDNTILDNSGLFGFTTFEGAEVTEFNDIIVSPFAGNEYLLSGYMYSTTSSSDKKSFICRLNVSNDSYKAVYKSDSLQTIAGILPLYSGLPTNQKVLFNGILKNSNNDLAFVLGRLGTEIGGGPSTVSEIETDKLLKIYPNPAGAILNVELPAESAVEIFSIQGSLMVLFPSRKFHQIDISSIPAGIYLLKAGSAVKKFIKQ